jgi:prepilin-type processing-associated H-X9-DG protein
MAVAALVVGVLAFVACPIGAILGLVALILGIIALGRARHLPRERGRRGTAVAGICLGGAAIVFWAGVLLPGVAYLRGLSIRAVCASNLSGIGMGMHTYCNDGREWGPTGRYAQPSGSPPSPTGVSFIGQMGADYTVPVPESGASAVHPSRSLFLLVIDGTCTPKQFMCPSSGDSEDDLRNTVGGVQRASRPGVDRFDFKGYPFLSYGFQFPFGRMAQPDERLDARVVLVADKGPFFKAGTPRSDGTVPDQIIGTPGSRLSIAGATQAAQLLKLGNKRWRPYNSRNHNQDGQNILFADAHVEFVKKPIVGVNYDNIYTVQGPEYTLRDSMLGHTPADKMGPFTDTDSVIVP